MITSHSTVAMEHLMKGLPCSTGQRSCTVDPLSHTPYTRTALQGPMSLLIMQRMDGNVAEFDYNYVDT